MLIVKPVQSKEDQKEFCLACGAVYDVDSLAYAAWVDGVLVGISQFRMSGGGTDKSAHIVTLACAKGTDDLDALFIMGRQTMNFIDLSGVHSCYLDDTPSLDFAKKLGFDELDDGSLFADLTDFFIEPCEHGKANSPR